MAFSINTNISRNLNIKPNSVTNVNIIDYEHQKENYSQTPSNYETEYENIDTENITDISNSSSYGNTTTSKENANTLNGYQSQTLEKPNTSSSSTEAMANIGMGIVGFTNGVGVAGEGVVDGAVTAATVIATPFTWIYDQVTGDNSTEEMWEASDAFVSEEYVNNFYAEQCENGIFQEMNDNASDIMKYGGEGYMLANNVGYVSGIIAFSSLGGSPTYYAALSGLGQGRETALQEGADSGEALLAGLGTATWEGVQWGVGAKLSGTGGLAVGFDTLSGAIDPVARSGIQTIYNGQSFEENFEAAGGYGAMAIGGITGLGFSALGEAVEVHRANRININMQPTTTFFENIRGTNNKYGIDQGVFRNLQTTNPRAYENSLNVLMTEYHFSFEDAVKCLDMVDEIGACVYARGTGSIVDFFKDYPNEFEEIFGYPLYIKNESGNLSINDTRLMLDLYCWGNTNRPKLFWGNEVSLLETDINGNTVINNDAIRELDNGRHSIAQNGGGYHELSEFLSSKTSNVSLNTSTLDDSAGLSIDELRTELSNKVANGDILSMGICNVPITRLEVNEQYFVGNHWVKITDITDDAIIVSSWGEKCSIPFEALMGEKAYYTFVFDNYNFN